MAQPVIQHSFAAGEWAPALNARVDLAKYHTGAALLRNFYVDYRGGASTRPGTKYILQAFKSATAVRLIPFQASFTVNYVLEFGDFYIRFYYNGAPVLETAVALTAATSASPAVLTKAGHGLSNGDWVYASGFTGGTWGTNLNGKYWIVTAVSGNDFGLRNLSGTVLNSTGFGTWSAGNVQRVYTLPSPYAAGDLAKIKYAQNVNTLVLCHPSYVPYVLTLISAASWTIQSISFGSTVAAPTNVTVVTTPATAGTFNYSYIVTAVDAHNNEESVASTAGTEASKLNILIPTNLATNHITWTASPGAVSYNVYRANPSSVGAIPAGSAHGYIGNVTGTALDDPGIAADFSITPPLPQNPFQGAGLASVTVTAAGTYTTVPTATVAAAPTGGVTATVAPVLGGVSAAPNNAGSGFVVGDIVYAQNPPDTALGAFGGISFTVASIGGGGAVATLTVLNPGSIASGTTPTNPIRFFTGGYIKFCTLDVTWGVTVVNVTSPGAGYTSVPAITFSAGAATATAVLYTASGGNPSVPCYYQQRLVLAGPTTSPQQFNMSMTANYYNYNTHFPLLPDDAVQGTIVSTQLNSIKAMLPFPSGLITFGDRAAWLINGGSGTTPVTPETLQANAQAYNGASDVPPIVANYDIIYVQAKGSIVRDLTFNFYTSIFTGTDISVLSSHLFYGYTITEWAFAEEPYKIIWAIRNDGVALTLTFLKEQEVIGWAHSDTTGLFKSVCSVVEQVSFGAVDAVYFVVERVINGNTVKYVERLAERIFPNGAASSWCVDAGLQYNGSPTASFTGGEQLAGATVTGLADGEVITPFVMPTNGNFTLPATASVVTVGLAFTPQLQTLPIDLGNPTVQSKMKKIPEVTLRVQETLGLSIGTTFSDLVPMKDLVVGNVGGQTNTLVTGLVTGDARTILDPKYYTTGQYCIQQSNPLPATILGVIPEITVGDTGR